MRGPEPPEILALSRRGRLPQPQTVFNRTTLLTDAVSTISTSGASLRKLVRVVHTLSRQLHGLGGDWREVVNSVRKIAPELWAGLSVEDRRRFLRHVRPIGTSTVTGCHPLPLRSCIGCRSPAGSLSRRARSRARPSRAQEIEVVCEAEGHSTSRANHRRPDFNCTGPDYRPGPIRQHAGAVTARRRPHHARSARSRYSQVAADGEVVRRQREPRIVRKVSITSARGSAPRDWRRNDRRTRVALSMPGCSPNGSPVRRSEAIGVQESEAGRAIPDSARRYFDVVCGPNEGGRVALDTDR